jgi:hypothetical protein
MEPRSPMDGQDLSVLFDGGDPDPRPHFTLGYHTYVWARDDRYVMFGSHDRASAKLFDLREDPEMRQDIAVGHPDVVGRMFDEYVIGDAGGPLPEYDG